VPVARTIFTTAAAAITAAAVLSGQPLSTPPASAYRLVSEWGTLTGGDAWGEVTGVDIDRANTIVAVRRTSPYIIEMNAGGQVLKRWGDGLVVWPHGFRIDRDGFLWLTDGRAADGKGQQVLKMTRSGARAKPSRNATNTSAHWPSVPRRLRWYTCQ